MSKKIGRPKKEIDLEELKKLASIQCTVEEICSIMEVSKDTFYTRLKEDEAFSDAYKKARDTGKCSLRRHQYVLAQKGNASMLIWLGKQYLGQVDTPVGTGEDDLEFV